MATFTELTELTVAPDDADEFLIRDVSSGTDLRARFDTLFGTAARADTGKTAGDVLEYEDDGSGNPVVAFPDVDAQRYTNRATTRALTSATTLTTDDHGKTILLDASGGAFPVTLPAHSAGLRIPLVGIDAANDITIQDAGSATVKTIAYTGQAVTLESDGTNWQEVDGIEKPLGVGQTWQDFSASSSAGVTYTNTTGRPIEVIITLISSIADGNETFLIDGNPVARTVARSATNYYMAPVSATIPEGSTYGTSANNVSGVEFWWELR